MTTGATTSESQARSNPGCWTSAVSIAIYFALTDLLIHFLTNGQYGYFRDELYYLACGEHLDWGYADCAPLIALVAKLSRTVLGDSLFAIRFFPAVAGAVTILLTGLMTIELGGKRFAVTLACLCVLIAPGYLIFDTLLTMNAFEAVFWMGCAYLVILAIKRKDPRYWIGFGLLAGLGLQNKHSMLFFGFGVVTGLLLTRERRCFANKWIWLAGALALAIFLPNLIWEYRHQWATLELLNNVQKTGKNVVLSPLQFIAQQIFILLPLTAPVWLAGLWFFFFDAEGKRFRLLGITYVVVLALMITLKGKNYYLLPVYPMLFAAGAAVCEKLLQARRALSWLKVAYPVVLVAAGVVSAPLVLPILPVETFLRYQSALGLKLPKAEVGHIGPLPQHFGDMFGWPELVETVARVYHSLPPEERAKAAIFASSYGDAGAIDLFGPRYGLPKAICPHQNYFFWGPRDYTGEVVIVLQGNREKARQNFASVEEAATMHHPYAMAEEHYTILICRGLKQPLPQVWPSLKHWN
ncbi:MAG: glycosyltransferase family 39 protein [Verrucomicrobia bacterium]|nr:glycosyltransferase family 39 protein [Verrucomicrobiota bacterium]